MQISPYSGATPAPDRPDQTIAALVRQADTLSGDSLEWFMDWLHAPEPSHDLPDRQP